MILLDSNSIVGSIPQELCKRHDSGDLQKLQVDCERGKIVGCTCCDCNGSSTSDMATWNYNQKATWSTLEALSGDKLSDPKTPQYKAAHWIVEEDKWHYPATSKFLYQRYVLVIFYYMMRNESWFKPDGDIDECKWERIGCDALGYVEHIKFGMYSMLNV